MKYSLFFFAFIACRSNMVIANSTLGITQAAPQALSLENIFQWLFGLIVVVAAIVGIGWLVKKFGKFTVLEPGKLNVVATISLSTREKVVLIKVDDTQLLIGVAPGHIQTLHVFDQGQPPSNHIPRSDPRVPNRNENRYGLKAVDENINDNE